MISDTTKLNRAFKATFGAAHTEDNRLFFQELFPYLLELIGGDVKTDPIPLTPVLTDDMTTAGVVRLTRRPLVRVPTTSNKVWAVCNLVDELTMPWPAWRYDLEGVWSPATRRTRFIHPRYDTPLNGGSNNLVTSRYVVQLFRHDAGNPPYYEGAQIPPTATPDGSPNGGWEFEYESGLLYFTAPPTAYTQPLHIRVYQYIGTLGNFGGVGSVQKVFSTPYNYLAPVVLGDVVYILPSPAGATDTVARADNTALATADAIGIVSQLDFPLVGQCVVQVAGEASGAAFLGGPNFWGQRMYLAGGLNAGKLQDTAPAVGVVKSLGIARSNSVLALTTADPLTVL